MASTNSVRFTAIGRGDTEEEAKQKAIANASAAIQFQIPNIVQGEYNEGPGVYTLIYTAPDNDDSSNEQDKSKERSDEAKKKAADDNKLNDNTNNNNGNTNGNSPDNTGNSSIRNNTKELRSTPGYTNYVVSTGKSIDGTISSSTFYKRYYSDISAELYINGEWFEDINTIQWQVQQQQYPIYGYNSYIFDDVALGSRIIQGQFSINFTEPNIIEKVIAAGTKGKTGNTAQYETYSDTTHGRVIAVNGSNATYKTNPVHNAIWKPRFDIDIVFGDKDYIDGVVYLPKHIILWDCLISNSGMGATANGGVLTETYTFMARDFKIMS